MSPIWVALAVIIVLVVIVAVARSRASVAAPVAGAAHPPSSILPPVAASSMPPLTANGGCPAAYAARVGVVGTPPGACVASPDAAWVQWANAIIQAPNPAGPLAGSPKTGLSLADCRQSCAANAACNTWVSTATPSTAAGAGATTWCYTFSAVPTSMAGIPGSTMGVRASAF